ncbi:MAG TPA: ATP-binding protein [Gemmatimonadales bacterium]|nr:ATP-binding protein [Gemmatimonadales bacterium]
MTFVKRFIAGTFIVLLVALGTLAWHAGWTLQRTLADDVAAVLQREARLVRAALDADSTGWQDIVRRYSAATGNRITLIDPAGRVVADSDFRPGPLPRIENHAGRPEVRAALEGRVGRDVRESETVGRDLMYVAIAGGPGVVRVAEDMSRATGIARHVQSAILGSALLALLVGLVAAAIASRAVARPLVELSGAARAIASGSPPRFPRSGIAEIDALVRALREMHQQLAARFGELRREKAESGALVESMVEGVIAADARGHISTANPAARRMLGYGATEALPDLGELFRSKAAREVVAGAVGGTGEATRTVELDGRTLLITARALPAGGAVLVLHDLTETRRLEAVRRDFVANVSHELRTPLTSISGYAETLLGDPPDAETSRRFLETIQANARRMQRLVDDLLDLSRLEAGRWQPEIAEVDGAALAREIWNDLADRRDARSIAFASAAEPGVTLHADPDALRHVLTNLLDNSLRHTPPGGRIGVTLRAADDGIAVDVSDTGRGIGRDHLPRIFERFYRADASRSREEGGTGLGLAIVKHLVEGHGGRVSAESEPGRGTTITCWFPE